MSDFVPDFGMGMAQLKQFVEVTSKPKIEILPKYLPDDTTWVRGLKVWEESIPKISKALAGVPVLTVDFEWFKGTKNIRYLLIGVFAQAYILDWPSLGFTQIPSEIVEWTRQFWFVGSGIKAEEGLLDIAKPLELQRLIKWGYINKWYRPHAQEVFKEKERREESEMKAGLGAISMSLHQTFYKLCENSNEFLKKYTIPKKNIPSSWLSRSGSGRWRAARSHFLYDWKAQDLSFALGYMRSDCLIPLAGLASITLQRAKVRSSSPQGAIVDTILDFKEDMELIRSLGEDVDKSLNLDVLKRRDV